MPSTRTRKFAVKPKHAKRRTSWRRRYLLWAAAGVLLFFYSVIIVSLLLLRWIDPPTTAVQMERRFQSWFDPRPYQKHYTFVPLPRVSVAFQHAVISAENARFYQHHGFDWRQVQLAAAEDADGKRLRGASTIDQQLVKNLFLTTSRSLIRKAIEATIVPFAEAILGKQRILEFYLNVVEWGPAFMGLKRRRPIGIVRPRHALLAMKGPGWPLFFPLHTAAGQPI